MLIPIDIPIVDEQVKNASLQPIHRIFCIDCSGSMSGDLDQIARQLKNKIPTCIGPKDFMSIIWFSGSHEYGTIFEHIHITDLKDISNINQALDRFLKPVGLTGFVQPIQLAKQLIEKYNQPSQVFFLTDGQENQSSTEECKKAFEEMNGIPLIIVEYKYCCDRKLLESLGQVSGGINIFNEDFEKFDTTFEVYMTNNVQQKTHQIPSSKSIIYIENSIIKMITPNADNIVNLPIDIDSAYQLDMEHPFFETEERIVTDPKINQVYMMILFGLQKKKQDIVQSCIDNLGDVHLSKMYSNCFTKQDYAVFEEYVIECINNPEKRFIEGVDLTFKPKDDAFNVVQMLKIIQDDKHALFYPYHPAFVYKAISKANETDKKWIPAKEMGCTFNLVSNKSRANVSLGCRVHGLEIEGETMKSVVNYRNFAVLKDGIKNIVKLPMTMSESTFNVLKSEGCIGEDKTYDSREIYVIDITNLPVVNRLFARSEFNSVDFCKKHVELHKLKSEMKYLKAQLKHYSQAEDEEEEVSYTREARDDSIPRDFYMATELQVKIAKCSSIPTINEKLLEKLEKGGKLTLSESLMMDIHQGYKHSPTLEWLMSAIQSNKQKSLEINEYLDQAKMALLVGGCWFTDVSAEQHTFLVDPFEVTVDIVQTKVYMN